MKTSEVIQRNEEQIRRIKDLLKRHEEEQPEVMAMAIAVFRPWRRKSTVKPPAKNL